MNKAVKLIVAIGIGAALFFVCGRFIAIPSPIPNVTINIQYGVLAFFAAAFGPLAGCLIGLIGHALIDFSYGWGIWWSWVIASAAFGFVLGLFKGLFNPNDGGFGGSKIVRFNVTQLIAHLIAWGIVAPALDIVIYAEPANKVFAQGIWACIGNVIISGILGSLLGVGYSAIRGKSSGLKKED